MFAGLQCARLKVVRIGDSVDDLLDVGAWAGVGGSEPPKGVARPYRDGRVVLRRRCIETDARKHWKSYRDPQGRQRDRRHEREPFAPTHRFFSLYLVPNTC